jgi:hypothetical protein
MTQPIDSPDVANETAEPVSVVPRAPRGGQLGNLNAVKNPWATYWRRRALRSEDRWVLRLVEDYVPQLVADKGGPESVSFAQRKVMELAAVCRACWALAMAHGDLRSVARFVNLESKCLADLGLERRAKPVLSASEIMRAKEQGE